MKIKKFYLILCVLLAVNQALIASMNTFKPQPGLNAAVDFEDILDESTPLEFSTKSLQAYFKNLNPTENHVSQLKSRSAQNTAKVLQFNKSFSKYIKETYNHKNYSLMLSQDGSHIIEFLKLCNELDLGEGTVYVGMRLFYNKMKSCEIIDDVVLIQLLEEVPVLLEPCFAEDSKAKVQDLTFIKNHVESLILSKLVDKFAEFQKKPDAFVSDLAQSIVEIMKKEENAKTAVEEKKEIRDRLYSVTMRFFDTALQRVIWYNRDSVGSEIIWRSFATIATGIQKLAEHDVIHHMDDLDDLYWSLIHRFCFYLDLSGATLPLEFYEQVENQLANKTVFFLEAKEQDEGIKTKKDTLLESLFVAKVKAIAFEKRGIVSHGMAY